MLKRTFGLGVMVFFVFALFIPVSVSEVVVFGPKQYTRSQGKPITETDNFQNTITGPDFTLKVINGDEQGDHRYNRRGKLDLDH
jgi:hypothetical protein